MNFRLRNGHLEAAFMFFLDRSACTITDLALTVPISEPDLVFYLRHVAPTLQTLSLLTNSVSPYGELMELSPKLRTISFDDCMSDILGDRFLSNMIESRWAFLEYESATINPNVFACSLIFFPKWIGDESK